MSKIYDILREFLEDVQTYLLVTLNSEILSTNALSRKESLLMKIQHIRKEIPVLIKTDELGMPVPPPRPPPKVNNSLKDSGQKSPPPYLDMQGSANTKPVLQPSPVAEHKVSNQDSSEALEEDYESYGCESEVSLESSCKTENSQSEDNVTDVVSGKYGEAPEFPAVDMARSSDKNGFLEKKGKERLGGLLNPFQRKWCAIKDGLFVYYNDPADRKQRASILLAGYEGRPAPSVCKDPNKKPFCFEIVSPGKRTYQFIAYSVKDMKQWITAIEKNSKVHANNGSVDQNLRVPEKPTLPISKSLPQLAFVELSDKIKSKPALPIPITPDEDIYEAVEYPDDEQLYEEGSSQRDSYNHEEIYIDADTEAPPKHPENTRNFKCEEWYVGLWDCTPSDVTELEFRHGDLIRIISKEFDKHDWWTGELNGKVGFVPKAYLQEAFEKP